MKTAFLQGGLFFDGQNNQPLWKKNIWRIGQTRATWFRCVYVNIWFSPKQRVGMGTTARCLPIILFVYPPFLICRLFIWEEKHASLHVQDLAKDVSTIVVFKVFLFSDFLLFSSWLVRDFKTKSAKPLCELLSNCFSVISSFDVGKDCTCKFMQ